MGMSTHIVAFIPATDPTFQKHLRIFNMCEKEGVSLPRETADYFRGEKPEVKLEFPLQEGIHFTKHNAESEDGVEVDLMTLPKDIKRIRFYNSY